MGAELKDNPWLLKSFTCPSCHQTYSIQNYNLGMSDCIELRCDRCSTTLQVGLYEETVNIFHDKYGLYTSGFFANLYNSLRNCHCGGRYSTDAAYRCRECNAPVSLDEIKKQIGYKGITPGIAMGKLIDSSNSKENIWKDPKDILPIKPWWKFW